MNLLEKGSEATKKVMEGAGVANQAPAGVIDKAISGVKKVGTEANKGLTNVANMSKEQRKAQQNAVKAFTKTYVSPVTKPLERKVAVAMALNNSNRQNTTEENSR